MISSFLCSPNGVLSIDSTMTTAHVPTLSIFFLKPAARCQRSTALPVHFGPHSPIALHDAKQYISDILKIGRQSLKQFALSSKLLSAAKAEHFGLWDQTVLDVHAQQLVDLLSTRGLVVPKSLQAGLSLDMDPGGDNNRLG